MGVEMVGVEDARKKLGALVDRAREGVDTVVSVRGRPAAVITAYREPGATRAWTLAADGGEPWSAAALQSWVDAARGCPDPVPRVEQGALLPFVTVRGAVDGPPEWMTALLRELQEHGHRAWIKQGDGVEGSEGGR